MSGTHLVLCKMTTLRQPPRVLSASSRTREGVGSAPRKHPGTPDWPVHLMLASQMDERKAQRTRLMVVVQAAVRVNKMGHRLIHAIISQWPEQGRSRSRVVCVTLLRVARGGVTQRPQPTEGFQDPVPASSITWSGKRRFETVANCPMLGVAAF